MTVNAQEGGFTTPAPHAIIVDNATGLVLFEKDARRPIAPASMTKIMTAEIVFDKIRDGSITLDTEFQVSEDAWRRGGVKSGSSTMFLDVGSSVRVEDLLRGVIIQSGNDACIVLAEGIAGSEAAFADLMTKHARAIGLSSATFKNATGWPHEDHKISLYDLAQLAKRSVEKYPEFYALYSEKNFTWNGITQGNRNPLLGRFPGADGLKTGHTANSGYGLVGSAERGGIRRNMVVNGLKSKAQRRDEGRRLMQAAFDQFVVEKAFVSGEAIGSVDVFMGKKQSVELIAEKPIMFGVFRGDRKAVKLELKHPQTIAAPIAKGDQAAELIVKIPGKDDMTFALLAAEDVRQKSAIARIWSTFISKIRG